MPSFLEGLGAGSAATVINNGINSLYADKEQRQFEKNQKAAFDYSQRAQINAPENLVEGLRRAGFSPAMATGQSFSPSAMASTPMQNKSAIPMDISSVWDVAQKSDMLDAQKDAIKAQAEKTQADADKTKVELGRMSAQDAESKDAMLNAIDRLEKQFGRDLGLGDLKTYLQSPDSPWNTGSVSAWLKSMDFERALSSNISGDVSDALDEMISQGKIEGNVADDIVHMSHSQRKLLDKQLTLLVKQLGLVAAQTDETKSRKGLNDETLKKVKEEIEKVKKEKTLVDKQTALTEANANNAKNADYRTKYMSGDYKGTAMVLGLDGLHSLLNMLGLLKR